MNSVLVADYHGTVVVSVSNDCLYVGYLAVVAGINETSTPAPQKIILAPVRARDLNIFKCFPCVIQNLLINLFLSRLFYSSFTIRNTNDC